MLQQAQLGGSHGTLVSDHPQSGRCAPCFIPRKRPSLRTAPGLDTEGTQGRLMAHHPNHEEYMNQRQAAYASVSPCAKLEGGSWRRSRWRRDPSRCGTGAHCVTRASQSSVCMPAMPISSAVYRAVCGHHLAVGKINSRCLCHTLRSSAFTRGYARLTGFAQKVSGLEEPYPREG
jgi:hypothetical protein